MRIHTVLVLRKAYKQIIRALIICKKIYKYYSVDNKLICKRKSKIHIQVLVMYVIVVAMMGEKKNPTSQDENCMVE